METKRVHNIFLSLQDFKNDKVKGYEFKYTKQKIAGQFFFKPSATDKRHTILLASRFNSNSRELNGPFPGWFIQMVGDRLSMGIGNGRTWLCVKSKQAVPKNKLSVVHFSLNNETKKAVLGLNNDFTLLTNVEFRCPVGFLTVGALNMRGEFRFTGELQSITIGTSLETVQNREKSLGESACNTKQMVEESHVLLDNIKRNLHDVDNDIVSLKDIKKNIDSWKLRGLQLNTDLLENQISEFIKRKNNFLNIIVLDTKDLSLFNHKIETVESRHNEKDNKNVFVFYKETMSGLQKDIVTLDNVVDELQQFKDLGVKLGTAFESIQLQRKNICTKIKNTLMKLQNYENNSKEMMNIVQLE